MKSKEVQIGLVDPATLSPKVWYDIKLMCEGRQGLEWFESVDLDEVFRKIGEGEFDLWLGTDGQELEMVCLCYWEKHAKVKHYHVSQLLGVELHFYLAKGLALLEQYTRAAGGRDLVIYGRPGWEKLLAAEGYKQEFIEVRKNVRNAEMH